MVNGEGGREMRHPHARHNNGPSDRMKVKKMPAAERSGAKKIHEAAKAVIPSMGDTDGTLNSRLSDIAVLSYPSKKKGVLAAAHGSSPHRNVDENLPMSSMSQRLLETNHLFGTEGTMQATSMSTVLRREQAVMDYETYMQLCLERQFRRHNPAHGFDRHKQDYVYYNHRSKGCYIPMKKSRENLTLTYNHMFDFSDGSRFLSGEVESERPKTSVTRPLTGTFKSLTRSSSKAPINARVSSDARGTRGREGTRNVSVDIARSLKVSELRPNPFYKKVIIEDVIAGDSHCVMKTRESIGCVLGKGKVEWEEVPERLRVAFAGEQTRFTASLDSARTTSMVMGNTMDETQHSRYHAASSYIPLFSATDMHGNHQVEQERGDQQPWSDKPSDQNIGRKHVLFTDQGDRVLLGFTENISPYAVGGDGMSSQYYEGVPEERKVGLRSSPPHENEASDTVPLRQQQHERRLEQQQQQQQQPSPTPLLSASRSVDHRDVLLPPVAIAQLREMEWFTTPASRKPLSAMATMMGSTWIPEKPLPFETSRLRYIREFDVGDAKPPQKMIHWWAAKTLQ